MGVLHGLGIIVKVVVAKCVLAGDVVHFDELVRRI